MRTSCAGSTPRFAIPRRSISAASASRGPLARSRPASSIPWVRRSICRLSLDAIVLPADQALSLDVLNREFNPFVSDPRGADGKPLVGPFNKGGEVYEGKTMLPVRLIMKMTLESMAVPDEAALPLLGALSEIVVIRTPAHQFRLGASLGNRVVFYGTDSVNGEAIDIGHAHIDQVVFTLAEKKFRLLKQMVHFDTAGQGGAPDDNRDGRRRRIDPCGRLLRGLRRGRHAHVGEERLAEQLRTARRQQQNLQRASSRRRL